MRRDEGKPIEAKGGYRVKNWKAYNGGFIARGDVMMWIEDSALATAADAGQPKRGRPCAYPDAMLTVKQVYRLPLRALQGFAQSLCHLAFPALPVPNYTTLSRRAQVLAVVLPVVRSGESLHLVVDSTSVKLFGEGERKVRKHGYSKRRSWRNVHLGLDVKTRQVRAALMTHRDVDDASVLPDLLDQIPADEDIEVLGGDGAYDTKAGHASIAARGAEPSIPPREGATHWPAGTPGAGWRNGVIDAIAWSSRQEWKKQSGYHRRVVGGEPHVSI